jgi:hypothetical protein
MAFLRRGELLESSEGFSIENLGREGIRYHEGNRALYVWTEFLKPKNMGVSTRITRWDPPHEGEVLDLVNKQRILNNIKEAIEYEGLKVEFES